MLRKHTACRVCGHKLGKPYLDLGAQPLANALIPPAFNPQHELTVPLAVALCRDCGLSQLTHVVDPDVLYSGYPFRAGTSAKWVEHCDALAFTASLHRVGRMLDIAANDGTCMKAFGARGWEVHGVDPAPCGENITQGYWPNVAVKGEFDLIVAQNVLGHVDDPVAFLMGCTSVLAPGGKVCIEVPHVRDLIQSCAFDTIYHEHLSYWSTRPLVRAANKAWLRLIGATQLLDVHGGSRRYWLDRLPRRPKSPRLPESDELPYRNFALKVEQRLLSVKDALRGLGDKRLWGYGANAKSTVILNALKARSNVVWPSVIIDDEPAKQGMLSPGLHIPIRGTDSFADCDVLWLFSWNNAETLKAKARERGFTGQFFLTHPKVCLDT